MGRSQCALGRRVLSGLHAVTLLHTNDIHGRIEGLARVATLVERIREETPHRLIYVDAGDVEETTTRLASPPMRSAKRATR